MMELQIWYADLFLRSERTWLCTSPDRLLQPQVNYPTFSSSEGEGQWKLSRRASGVITRDDVQKENLLQISGSGTFWGEGREQGTHSVWPCLWLLLWSQEQADSRGGSVAAWLTLAPPFSPLHSLRTGELGLGWRHGFCPHGGTLEPRTPDTEAAGDPEAAGDWGAGCLPPGRALPSLPVPGQQPEQQVGAPSGLPHPDSQLCWGAAAPEQLHGESLQLGKVSDGM